MNARVGMYKVLVIFPQEIIPSRDSRLICASSFNSNHAAYKDGLYTTIFNPLQRIHLLERKLVGYAKYRSSLSSYENIKRRRTEIILIMLVYKVFPSINCSIRLSKLLNPLLKEFDNVAAIT